jgi:hypothetical protein
MRTDRRMVLCKGCSKIPGEPQAADTGAEVVGPYVSGDKAG